MNRKCCKNRMMSNRVCCIEKGEAMEQKYTVIENVIRDSFAGVVWTHKIQEKQADIYAGRYKLFEIINITAASLTSVGIVSLIFTNHMWIKLMSAAISFVSVFVSAYYKSFDLQKLIVQHKNTANKLIEIRDLYKILLTKVRMQSESIDELMDEYRNLVERTDLIYKEAPITSDRAVDKASYALKIKKDNCFTDSEIDSFLPKELRRG